MVFFDAHAFQHRAGGLDHGLWAAEVVFQGGWVFVLTEVFAVEHLVDETGVRGLRSSPDRKPPALSGLHTRS